MRFITGFRLFFVAAMFTAGFAELASLDFISTPATQLTASAVIGAGAVFLGKISGAFV